MPWSSGIFVTGMFVVTALPPFGPFFSELGVVRAAFATGRWGVATLFLACLVFAFFGLTRVVFGVVDGRPRPVARAGVRRFPETAGLVVPQLLLLGFSLWLGLHTPDVLRDAWSAAVLQLYPAP
jgi:hydrogenase-4 component F